MEYIFISDFSMFQVLAGGILVLATLLLALQVRGNIPDKLRSEWRKTSGFIVFFFTVYILFILFLTGRLLGPITASVFFISACFGCLIMMLIKSFMKSLSDKDAEIKEVIGQLRENNEELGREIAERIETEERLRLYGKVMETMRIGVTISDTDGRIIYTNPADAGMHGYSVDELIGKDVGVFAPGGRIKRLGPDGLNNINVDKRESTNIRKDGSTFPVQLISAVAKNPDGEPIGIVNVCEDISDRKLAEQNLQKYRNRLEELVQARTVELSSAVKQLESENAQRRRAEQEASYMAYHDSLTGLPNRYSLLEMLSKALARARRTGKVVATLFLDLDNFKRINDTLGHNIGDLLLKDTAHRLSACLRKKDSIIRVKEGGLLSTVSRLGGDEFVLLLADIDSGQDAEKVAKRVLDATSVPFSLDGHEMFITTSIGISLFPEHGDDPDSLLKHADSAMYHAKGQGRNNYQFYDRSMEDEVVERLKMEHNLITALKRDEFHVCYQPQYSLPDGGIIGMESLIRWRHPELGLVSPAEFIPVAEENGLIVPIGEWILRTVCSHYSNWMRDNGQDFRVSVNLSGYQFRQADLIDTVTGTLKEFGIPPDRFEIELTESIIMRDAEETVGILNELKKMGVRVSIDDFGTGYSSLNYLKRFPIDTLKIDQSFIREVPGNPDDASIVKTIVDMGHNLNMTVIAEGVETQEQHDFLVANGCDAMQGFLFCQPLPHGEVMDHLINNGWKKSA